MEETHWCGCAAFKYSVIFGPKSTHLLWLDQCIPQWRRPVRRPLKDFERLDAGFFGNFGDSRDASGARANYADTFIGEIAAQDKIFGPPRGVELFPLEVPNALDVGQGWLREKAEAADEKCRPVGHTSLVHKMPGMTVIVPNGRCDPRVELDIFTKIVFICHSLNVFQSLRLRREGFPPVPFLQQFLVPRETIRDGFTVEAGARVFVEEPKCPQHRTQLQVL